MSFRDFLVCTVGSPREKFALALDLARKGQGGEFVLNELKKVIEYDHAMEISTYRNRETREREKYKKSYEWVSIADTWEAFDALLVVDKASCGNYAKATLYAYVECHYRCPYLRPPRDARPSTGLGWNRGTPEDIHRLLDCIDRFDQVDSLMMLTLLAYANRADLWTCYVKLPEERDTMYEPQGWDGFEELRKKAKYIQFSGNYVQLTDQKDMDVVKRSSQMFQERYGHPTSKEHALAVKCLPIELLGFVPFASENRRGMKRRGYCHAWHIPLHASCDIAGVESIDAMAAAYEHYRGM